MSQQALQCIIFLHFIGKTLRFLHVNQLCFLANSFTYGSILIDNDDDNDDNDASDDDGCDYVHFDSVIISKELKIASALKESTMSQL